MSVAAHSGLVEPLLVVVDMAVLVAGIDPLLAVDTSGAVVPDRFLGMAEQMYTLGRSLDHHRYVGPSCRRWLQLDHQQLRSTMGEAYPGIQRQKLEEVGTPYLR